MKRKMVALAALAAAAMPLAAAAQDAGGVPPAFVRVIANATVGHGPAAGRADALVYFSGGGNETRVVGIATLAPGDPWVDAPEAAVAVLRTRGSTPGGNRAPDPADIDYVQRTGLTVFVAGEWRDPAVIWEIQREGDGVRVRDIDRRGRGGRWRPAGQ
jgi:hypothetical protein